MSGLTDRIGWLGTIVTAIAATIIALGGAATVGSGTLAWVVDHFRLNTVVASQGELLEKITEAIQQQSRAQQHQARRECTRLCVEFEEKPIEVCQRKCEKEIPLDPPRETP